jgi:O-antigen/teichoic acid export membrane protein
MMHLVFGARWDAAVPLVQLFAFIGMFRVGGAVSAALLTAEGMVARAFRVELVSAVLRVIILLALVPRFGLIGAASGVAAIGLIEEVFYLVITFRHTGLRARDLAFGVWRPALATGVMVLVLLAAGLHQPGADEGLVWHAMQLAGTVLLGAVVYGATLLLAWIASGRPRGAETYVLGMARQAIRFG